MNMVRHLSAGVALAATCTCLAEAPKPLTWSDLVNHPERWPAETKLATELQFTHDTLKAGTPLQIDEVSRKGATLIAPQGFVFDVTPKDCDLLAAANVQWASLTPEQRALTTPRIVQDPSLWPAKVMVTSPVTFGSLAIKAGTEWPVVNLEKDTVGLLFPMKDGVNYLPIKGTDLFLRARKLAALPLARRPGRMAELFAGSALDADGEPVELPAVKYYVLYYGSTTCPRCVIFTPKLVDHYNQALAGRKDVQFMTWTGDDVTAPMLDYVKQYHIPWPTLPAHLRLEDRIREDYGLINTPGIVVLDRFGTILLASSRFSGPPMDVANEALARLDSVLKPDPADSK